MQTAAENGAPGVVSFALLHSHAGQVWPLARAQQTEENRYPVIAASGIVMCTVGFIVTGQFVSLGGLEIPYYVAMIGVILLKNQAMAPSAAVKPAPSPAQPRRAGGFVLPDPIRQ